MFELVCIFKYIYNFLVLKNVDPRTRKFIFSSAQLKQLAASSSSPASKLSPETASPSYQFQTTSDSRDELSVPVFFLSTLATTYRVVRLSNPRATEIADERPRSDPAASQHGAASRSRADDGAEVDAAGRGGERHHELA